MVVEQPTVLLLHELPDGSSHFDWLIAPDTGGLRPLVSFRLGQRVDQLRPGMALAAERIAEHRPAWIDLEGPVSGGRGTARRLARGRVVSERTEGAAWLLEIAWDSGGGGGGGGPAQQLRLEPSPAGGAAWSVSAEETGP